MVGSKRLGYEIIIIISYLRPRPLGLQLYHLFQPQQAMRKLAPLCICAGMCECDFYFFRASFFFWFCSGSGTNDITGTLFSLPEAETGQNKKKGQYEI